MKPTTPEGKKPTKPFCEKCEHYHAKYQECGIGNCEMCQTPTTEERLREECIKDLSNDLEIMCTCDECIKRGFNHGN